MLQAMLDEIPTNERLAELVRRAIAESPKTKTSIAAEIGITPQAITGWETTGKVAREMIGKLARVLGLRVGYFYDEELEPDDWTNITGYSQSLGLGEGTEPQEYAEAHKLKFRASSLQRKRLNPDKLAVMYGRGESMLPRIRSGDAVLFDTSDTRPQDECLFVVTVDGKGNQELSVKRCTEIGGDWFFEALNPDGDHTWRKPRRMSDPRNPITILGRVRWIGSWED